MKNIKFWLTVLRYVATFLAGLFSDGVISSLM